MVTNMKIRMSPVLAVILFSSLRPAWAEAPSGVLPDPLPLDWCLERAASTNPRIASESAAADAAQERIVPAGALDDPRFGYEASNLPTGDLDFSSTPLSGHQFGLKQKVPFPGLLGNRKKAARAAALAAGLRLEDSRLRVASAVETAWAELGFAQRALRITERNTTLLRQLTQIAEVKYAVGSGLQQDVLRAQVGLTSLLQERLTRQAAIARAGAELMGLLDLPADTEFPETAALADASALPRLEELPVLMEAKSPLLRAFSASIEAAERLRGVAELEGYPDFDFNVGYRLRERVGGDPVDGDDFIGAGVTIRLPINRSKWRARVAETRALVRRAQADYRATHARLRDSLRTAFAELVRADSELKLLETGLIPQARQSLESSRSGYEVGRIDFLSLLDSQIRLLDAELRRVRTIADRRRAFAALEGVVGEELR